MRSGRYIFVPLVIVVLCAQAVSAYSCYIPPYPESGEGRIFGQDTCRIVYNGPPNPTAFTIREPKTITKISTYHWNSGRGNTPGTIGLKDQSGKKYGPWQATGLHGQGGVPNAYWAVYLTPGLYLPAGTYTFIDSSPSTWSYNSESGNRGIVSVIGKTAVSVTCPWTGTWDAGYGWGQMTLQQSGGTVTGTYTHEQGQIKGTISGNKLIGTFKQFRNGKQVSSGEFEFEMANDCTFTGKWRYAPSESWRTGSPKAAKRIT